LSQKRRRMFRAESVRRVSDPHPRIKSGAGSIPLPPRERNAYAEVQEETSCRGLGGVAPTSQSPPKSGARGLKTDSSDRTDTRR
jgi:hypothetical protein